MNDACHGHSIAPYLLSSIRRHKGDYPINDASNIAPLATVDSSHDCNTVAHNEMSVQGMQWYVDCQLHRHRHYQHQVSSNVSDACDSVSLLSFDDLDVVADSQGPYVMRLKISLDGSVGNV